MSRYIDLGTPLAAPGKPFRADLDIILRSNLLVQANSGGGKSWLLRRMIEQSFKRVQQIVIDPEGEFSTLREKFDFVLVGKGGDTPADMRSAKLLAHRLLKIGASAIIDLYEMSKLQRPLWVATFIQALVDAPKELWHDLLIYIDEAHELAPEPGHGATESRDEKMCRHALIDLGAKGRKRGYGTVAATQRLGKLSKDFAAELKNELVGQTWIDIDRERAAGSLGIAKADKPAFFSAVKTLEPGNFFALGRALALESTLVRVADVQTEHPEAGRKQSAAPPPTAKIIHLLPQLADLPKEAEEKLLTEKQLKARIAELEREVARKPQPAPIVEHVGREKRVEVPVIREADLKRIERFTEKLVKTEEGFKELIAHAVDRVAQAQQTVVSSVGTLTAVIGGKSPSGPLKGVPDSGIRYVTPHPAFVDPGRGPRQAQIRNGAPDRREVDKDNAVVTHTRFKTPDDTATEHLPEKSQRMLGALMQGEAMGLRSMPFSAIAIIAGVSPNSGTTSNRKRSIVQGGYVTVQGDHLTLTDKGRAYPVNVEMPPTERLALLEYWKREIGTEKVAAMLDFVVKNGGATDDELRGAAAMTNSGTFSNYKRELTGRGLMVKQGDTYVPAEAFNR